MFVLIPISICVDLLPGHTYEDLLVGPKLILAYILHRSLLYTNSNCYTEKIAGAYTSQEITSVVIVVITSLR